MSYLKMDDMLIKKVLEHEVLYNHKIPGYRDQHTRQTIWDKIGKELRISGDMAKDRWNKLRRSYCNARARRRQEARQGIDSKKRFIWKYEQQMSFLIPFTENKRCSNDKYLMGMPTTQEWSDAEETGTLKYEGDQLKMYAENAGHFQNNEFSNEHLAAAAVAVATAAATNDEDYHDPLLTMKREDAMNTANLMAHLDETDMFFLSMSRMTKQLPKVEQSQIKFALSNSVLTAEIRNQKSLTPLGT